ncbi:MAG: DUF1844 domain-containing protein [Planctomycetia bacterium]|nr:DUF1844 domain-containing protein [Planctomycetia bacterium]
MSEEDIRTNAKQGADGCGCGGCGCGHNQDEEEHCGCGCDHGDGDCGCEHNDDGCGCGGGCGCGQEESEDTDGRYDDQPLGKPTLITIASTIAQQAMVSMGVLPNPVTGKTVFLMNQATYLIESIEVLLEKTKGNCTEEETRVLENVAHELRMLFVAATREKTRREQG